MIRAGAEVVVVLLSGVGLLAVFSVASDLVTSRQERKLAETTQARRERIAKLERALAIENPVYADQPAPREGELVATFELRRQEREPYRDGELYGRTRKFQR